MTKPFHYFSLFLSIFFFSTNIYSASFDFKVNILHPQNSKLTDLVEFDPSSVESEYETIEDVENIKSDIDLLKAIKLRLKIPGKLENPKKWNMTFNNKLLKTDSSGLFEISFTPNKSTSAFAITLISNDGNVKSQKIGFQIQNFKEFLVFLREKKTPMQFIFSLGSSFMNYSQTNVPDLEESLLQTHLETRVDLDPGNIFGHISLDYLHPSDKTDPPIVTIAYAKTETGLNKILRGSFLPSNIKNLVITGGLMYHSTLVEPKIFGYPGISGAFGRLKMGIAIGTGFEFDISTHYGSFLWGGQTENPSSRELFGGEFSFSPKIGLGGKWNTSFAFDNIAIEEGDVSVFFTSIHFGYLFQL